MATDRRWANRTFSLLVLAFAAAPAWAIQLGLPDPVDPRTYVSPSGQWRLEVDPSQIYGEGSAEYVMKNAGKVAWEGRRAFTFLEAAVTDKGAVAGYSYSGGVMKGEGSKIHFVILDARGGAVLDVTQDRRESHVVDGGPEPWVNGILLDAETDRVTFRVDEYQGEEVWKTFRLSDGKVVASYQLAPPPVGEKDFAWLNALEVVKGTPFNVVAWGVEPEANDDVRSDVRFALVDTSGKTYWQYELSRDRAPRATRGEDGDFSHPGIVPVDEPGRFDVRAFRTGERIRFRVGESRGADVQVSEVQRGPYESRAKEAGRAAAPSEPTTEAQVLSSIMLGRGREGEDANPTRGVERFDIDARGRFGFARGDSTCAFTFVLIEGETRHEQRLGSLQREAKDGCYGALVAWAGGSTWLVTQEFAKGGTGRQMGWWIDAEKRTQRPFTLSEPLMSRALAGTGQGSVVLLAADEDFSETLLSLDSNGQENRSFRNAFEANRGELLSPEDVTVTRTGDIAQGRHARGRRLRRWLS